MEFQVPGNTKDRVLRTFPKGLFHQNTLFNLSPLGAAESRSQMYQNWDNFNKYVPKTQSY